MRIASLQISKHSVGIRRRLFDFLETLTIFARLSNAVLSSNRQRRGHSISMTQNLRAGGPKIAASSSAGSRKLKRKACLLHWFFHFEATQGAFGPAFIRRLGSLLKELVVLARKPVQPDLDQLSRAKRCDLNSGPL